MPIIFENLPRDYEQLQVPVYILKGHSSSKQNGLITVYCDSFPPQYFEVNDGYFKLLLNFKIGPSHLIIQHIDGIMINGYPSFNNGKIYDEIKCSINYSPIEADNLIPKIHLCILLAKDSPELFDCPKDKLFEGNGLQTAIKKLRTGGRLIQAFTLDEMSKGGLGKRCFRFIEEQVLSTISKFEESQCLQRDEIKVHIIRTNKTTKEIRDANIAQQNKNAKKSGELFSIALDALKNSQINAFHDDSTNKQPALAAVMIMDAHWDKSQNLILGHAALGGGTSQIKLAIFGSQALHSWPVNMEHVYKCFTDTTRINTNEVANDCNESSSYWECLTVSLGAFMHEIGHSLGCPHQENGVMLRDYVTMNRKFLTRERYCIRTERSEWHPVLAKDEPGWHRLDLIRFLNHPAFSIPSDFQYFKFKPRCLRVNQGMKVANEQQVSVEPRFIAVDNNTLEIQCDSGIYLIECFVNGKEFPTIHYEYLPKFYGGIDPQRTIRINYDLIISQLSNKRQGQIPLNSSVNLKILSIGFGERILNDLRKFLFERLTITLTEYPRQLINRSELYGEMATSNKIQAILPRNISISSVKVTHGLALDGIRFFFTNGQTLDFGNFKNHNSDFLFDYDEYIIGFNVRSGGWVDSIQFITNKKITRQFGGNGGSLHKFIVPPNSKFVGFYGSIGQWCNQIGFMYT